MFGERNAVSAGGLHANGRAGVSETYPPFDEEGEAFGGVVKTKIQWPFGTDLALVKLKRLYPPLESSENSVEPQTSEPVKTSVSAQ